MLGVVTSLASRGAVSHIAFSVDDQRVWLVCPRCGRWNLPTSDCAKSLLRECVNRFSRANGIAVVDGVAQLRVGSLRLIRIDAAKEDELFAVRHGDRVTARFAKQQRLGALLMAPVLIGMAVVQKLIGSPYGAYAGAAGAFAALSAVGLLQRRRRMVIRRGGDGPLVIRRGDARNAAITCDQSGWALEITNSAGLLVLRGPDAMEALARIIVLFPAVAMPPAGAAAPALLSQWNEGAAIVNLIVDQQGADIHAQIDLRPTRRTIRSLTPQQRLALEAIATASYEGLAARRGIADLLREHCQASMIATIIERELTDA